jgi:hypothetical protein
MIVGKASNASEATSSKTMGLIETTLSINGIGNVITEGLLTGLDTTGATNAGDPVWLGTDGNLIYGLTNKPYAPAHLVFIGIVTRRNANNGEIFVKVQNGFELKEIHDVDLITTTPINGHILGYNGTLWVNKTIAGWLGYTPANAANYVPYTGATTNVDLGTYTLTASTVYGKNLIASVNGTTSGSLFLLTGTNGVALTNDGVSLTSSPDTARTLSILFSVGGTYTRANINGNGLTTQRTYTLPDATGTIALTSNIPSITGLVPYTGANSTVNLGSNTLIVREMQIWKGLNNDVDSTAIGRESLASTTSSDANTAFGDLSLRMNTTGSYNTAAGCQALMNNTTGSYNTAFGTFSLGGGGIGGFSGGSNTAVGYLTGCNITTGSFNTFIGRQAGNDVTTGNYNTIVGRYVGTSTMTSNVILADGEGNIRFQWDGTNIKLNGNTVGSNAFTSTAFVPQTRTLTINGTAYDLSADRSWTVTPNINATNTQDYTATAGQAVFTVTGGYTVGQLAVFYNGSKLSSAEFTAINGTSFTLATAAQLNDILQTVVSVTGGGIGGSGTTNELAYFTASGVIGSLSTGTYPSLTELSYVKGVTSAIQTQFNGKQAALNGTGFVKISGTTISYDNSTYLTTSSASSTYLPLAGGTLSGQLSILRGSGTGLDVASDLVIFRASTGFATPRQITLAAGNGPTTYLEAKGYGANYITDFGIRTYNSSGTAFEVFFATSSGNVGIGTTSPNSLLHTYLANGANDNRIIVQQGSNGYASAINLIANNDDGGRFNFINSSTNGGTTHWQIGGSGSANTLAMLTGGTERMRITSGGNVLVSRSSLFNAGTYTTQKLQVSGAIGINSDSADGVARLSLIGDSSSGDGIIDWGGNGNFNLRFSNNGSERMRITSGGDLCIGKTSATWTSNGLQTEVNGQTIGVTNSSGGTNNLFLRKNGATGAVASFYYDSTEVGKITITSTTTSYNTTSDYRLKQDLKDFQGLALVCDIKTYDYEWKTDQSRAFGVMAHELQEIIPQAVVGQKDGKDMQGVDYSKLVPILVKAIQEQTQIIKNLEARIKQLENK